MSCERVRDWSAAALLGEAPAEAPADVRAHLAECITCRRELDEARTAWRALGVLAAAAAPSVADETQGMDLTARRGGPGPGPGGGWMSGHIAWPVRAAVVVLALAAGWVGGRLSAGRAAEVGAPGVASAGAGDDQYLLLIRETPATLDVEARVGTEALVAEYSAWAGSLAEAGRLVSAEKLAAAGDAISGDAREAVDANAPGAVSGFFLVTAPNADAAREIARRSPHVRHGGIVEVRAIERSTPR